MIIDYFNDNKDSESINPKEKSVDLDNLKKALLNQQSLF